MSNWRNRIVETGVVSPRELIENPKNWRIHPTFQQNALEAVLEEVGWVDDVIVNKTTGIIIDGHLRVTLAIRNNEEQIPVKWVELSEAEEDMVLSTFDTITGLAAPDVKKRDELIAKLTTDRTDILAMFGKQNSLLPEIKLDLPTELGNAPPAPSLSQRDGMVVVEFPLFPEERERFFRVVNAIKQHDGLETTREAVISLLDFYERNT